MTDDTIDIDLPAEYPGEVGRECHMSIDLFQNASTTMGELRDMMRASGISWETLQKQIERPESSSSAIGRILDTLDDYSTGIGRSLHDKPSNLK